MRIHLILKVWQRNWLIFQRNWLAHTLWISIEPLLYLAAIGYGLGSYVQNIEGQSYIDFYYPGLLCHTAVLVSFFEATYGSYSKLHQNGFFSLLTLTPLRVKEILLGELLWCASKGFLAVFGVFIIASFFGLNTWMHFATLPIVFILCLLFALIGLMTAFRVKSPSSFVYSASGFVIPLTLISGIYFPVSELSLGFRLFSYFSPITHALELMRTLIRMKFEWYQLFQFLILIFLLLVLTQIYLKLFNKSNRSK